MGNINKLVSLPNGFHKLLGENRCCGDSAFTCMYVQKDYITIHAPLCSQVLPYNQSYGLRC